MTLSNEHHKLLKKFKQLIDTRDMNKMDKALYNHLHLHCRFIAHYNIHGFREFYSEEGFRVFVNHFKNPPFYGISYPGYEELNLAMQCYVRKQYSQIMYELDNLQINKELKLLKRLADKHGHLVTTDKTIHLELGTHCGNNGQLEFIL